MQNQYSFKNSMNAVWSLIVLVPILLLAASCSGREKAQERVDDGEERGTIDSLMEMAKDQAAQKAAEGDWDSAQKILESARAMSVSIEGEMRAVAVTSPLGTGKYAGETKSISLPGGATMEMVWCPPGIFTMGSPDGEDGHSLNEQQHRVRFTKGFWIAKYEVTQGQWKSVMEDNPSEFSDDDKKPVEHVDWNQCQVFCQMTDLQLPTDAQWEYACRAGSTGPYAGNLDSMGWYSENSGTGTHPVGEKSPNAWGLYDMHGNVWEWCADWWDDQPGESGVGPQGAPSGLYRVAHGGGWSDGPGYCRSAFRAQTSPSTSTYDLGLRPVKLLP